MLKNLLYKIAKKNIKIYILIYKEISLALPIESNYTKEILNNLHPNIKVTRYPKSKTNLLWSNHEKIIIIDQKKGYLGGVDLCWGRFDNNSHLLTEIKNSETSQTNHIWPGKDYSNVRISDFENLEEFEEESLSRNLPRLPWHDIHCYLEGNIIYDLSKHFIERWNFARSDNTSLMPNKKFTIVNVKSSNKNDFISNIDEKSNYTQSLIEPEFSHMMFFNKKTDFTVLDQNLIRRSASFRSDGSFVELGRKDSEEEKAKKGTRILLKQFSKKIGKSIQYQANKKLKFFSGLLSKNEKRNTP